MQDWETLIAHRTEAHRESYKPQRIEDPVKRNRAIYEKSPRRIAMHKAWEKSPAGKKSMRERCKRYQQTEKGRETKRKSSRLYFLRHKDNPEWRAHRRELQRAWRDKQKLKTKE